MIEDRLAPLEAQIGNLRVQAKEEARQKASVQFNADILAAVEDVRPFAEDYLRHVEDLRAKLEAWRLKGLYQTVTTQTALKELMAIVAKANTLINGGMMGVPYVGHHSREIEQ